MKLEEEINQSRFSNPQQKAIVNIIYTGNWLGDKSDLVLKPHQLNQQHYNILRIIKGRYPDSICPSDVKKVLLNKKGDLTRLLDKLVKMDLVERNLNEENRRSIDLIISKKGIKLLEELLPEIEKQNALKGSLTDKEALQLSDLLDKIRV